MSSERGLSVGFWWPSEWIRMRAVHSIHHVFMGIVNFHFGSCHFNTYFFLGMASGSNISCSNLPCIDMLPTKFGSLWPDVVFQPRILGRNRHDNFVPGQVVDRNQVSFDTSPLFLLRDFVNTTIRRLSASLTRNSTGFEVF